MKETFEKVLNKLVVPQFDKLVEIKVEKHQPTPKHFVGSDSFYVAIYSDIYYMNFHLTSPISSDERTEMIEASYSVFRMIGIEDSKFRFKFEFH